MMVNLDSVIALRGETERERERERERTETEREKEREKEKAASANPAYKLRHSLPTTYIHAKNDSGALCLSDRAFRSLVTDKHHTHTHTHAIKAL